MGKKRGDTDLQAQDFWADRTKRVRSYSQDYKGAIHGCNQFALRYLQEHAKAAL